MASLALTLEGVTIVFTIRGQLITLTAPTARITTGAGGGGGGGGGGAPHFDGSILFKYEKSFEESVDMGTPGEMLAAIQELTANIPTPAGGPAVALADQWEAITTKLQAIPVLNQAGNVLLTTHVHLTAFEIGFSKIPLV